MNIINKEAHDSAIRNTLEKSINMDKLIKQLHDRAVKDYANGGPGIASKHFVYMSMKSGRDLCKMDWADVKNLFEAASPEGTRVSVGKGLIDIMMIPGFSVWLILDKEED
ncbi:MAG: hypothetical protein WCI79_00200 [Candidatus Saccharibacteria bacterium]